VWDLAHRASCGLSSTVLSRVDGEARSRFDWLERFSDRSQAKLWFAFNGGVLVVHLWEARTEALHLTDFFETLVQYPTLGTRVPY
jgi:hypothetical protein